MFPHLLHLWVNKFCYILKDMYVFIHTIKGYICFMLDFISRHGKVNKLQLHKLRSKKGILSYNINIITKCNNVCALLQKQNLF